MAFDLIRNILIYKTEVSVIVCHPYFLLGDRYVDIL